jgi:hypothetical protein
MAKIYCPDYLILLIKSVPIILTLLILSANISFAEKHYVSPEIEKTFKSGKVREALYKAIPPGTPKETVDRILIDQFGAKYKIYYTEIYGRPNENNIHQYEYKRPFWKFPFFLTSNEFLITVFFHENNQVKADPYFLEQNQHKPFISISTGPSL